MKTSEPMGAGNPYYGILTFVSAGGKRVSREQLVRRYGERITNEVIACGAIIAVSGSDPGNPIYVITEHGRKLMNQ